MDSMIKMCKDCINAKNRTNEPMMYCGKHRRYITQYTMAYSNILDQKECKDYDSTGTHRTKSDDN